MKFNSSCKTIQTRIQIKYDSNSEGMDIALNFYSKFMKKWEDIITGDDFQSQLLKHSLININEKLTILNQNIDLIKFDMEITGFSNFYEYLDTSIFLNFNPIKKIETYIQSPISGGIIFPNSGQFYTTDPYIDLYEGFIIAINAKSNINNILTTMVYTIINEL